MNSDDVIKAIREAVIALVKEKYSEYSAAAEQDIDEFLKASKAKLIRWGGLLKDGSITPEEFKLLLHSQKDVLVIATLYQAGISKISLGHLKNRIIKVVIDTVLTFIV